MHEERTRQYRRTTPFPASRARFQESTRSDRVLLQPRRATHSQYHRSRRREEDEGKDIFRGSAREEGEGYAEAGTTGKEPDQREQGVASQLDQSVIEEMSILRKGDLEEGHLPVHDVVLS